MVSSTKTWRLSDSILLVCLILLVVYTIGLGGYWIASWAYPYWWPKTVPGAAEFDKGSTLMADGDLNGAIEAFGKAIDKNHHHALAVFYQAKARQKLGETNLAIDGYTEALRLHKEIDGMKRDQREKLGPVPLGYELANAYLKRATLLDGAGKPDEAIKDFTEALSLNAESADACCGRGAAYLATGFAEQAIVDINEAIRLDPDSHKAFCLRARADLAAGKQAQAIEDARRAIHLDANCGDAFLTLGSAILSAPSQQRDEAVKALMDAFRLYKAALPPLGREQAIVYYNLSVSLHRAGETAAAKKAFDEALRLDPTKYAAIPPPDFPKRPDPKLVRAQSWLAQNLLDDAIAEFTAILLTDPKNIEALLGHGTAFLRKKDWDAAVEDFNELIKLNPHSAEVYCLRAQAYLGQGDYYRAKLDATQAIRLKPDYARAYLYRADAYCKGKDFDLALANVAEAMRLDRKAGQQDLQAELRARDLYVEIYQAQARAYTDARQWKMAVDSLVAIDKLKETLPFPATAHDRLERQEAQLRQQEAQAYQDLGSNRLKAQNWDEAIGSFEKAISLENDLRRELAPKLAQAHRERGFDRANHRQFPNAVDDLNMALDLDRAFDTDKDIAQTYRVCGLTCRLMAKDCHDRGRIAEEKEQWKYATQYLKRAIWLDPELEYELQRPLENAESNSTRLAALSSATQPIGL